MKNPMTVAISKELTEKKTFQWRMNGGENITPHKMETSHLFYTLRMIWNNSAPASKRVGKVKLYAFGSFYTKQYMKTAVEQMVMEISQRELTPMMESELWQIWNHIKNQKALPQKHKELT